MKLCRFDDDRLGVVIGDVVHDVSDIQAQIRAAARYDMKGDAVIAALPTWRKRIEDAAAKAPATLLAHVKLISPVARPSKTMGAPANYKKHIEEMRSRTDIKRDDFSSNRHLALSSWWSMIFFRKPVSSFRDHAPAKAAPMRAPRGIGDAGIFLKANSSIVGPSEGIPLRFLDRINEHEIELVVIIGKPGSDIPRERAKEHIAGYTLGIDVTCRGGEDRSFRKSIDGYSVVGPWLVTADEIPDPGDVKITLTNNGELRQIAHTGDLIYDVGRLIELASSFYTLNPGDILYTGTPQGVAAVKPGDVLRGKCDLIGELKIEVRAHRA